MPDLYKEYVPNQEPVQAVVLTKKNVESVAIWCGGTVIREKTPGTPEKKVVVSLRLPPFGPNREGSIANIGDVVVHNRNEKRGGFLTALLWSVWSTEDFYKRFKERA